MNKFRLLHDTLLVIIMVSVLLSQFFSPAVMSALSQGEYRECRWTVVDKPGPNGNVVVDGSSVSDIAIGGSVFYAVDNVLLRLYRSMSGGLRWEDITGNLVAAGATLPIQKIAVAPDQAAIVAAATDGGTALYLSVDGGITWGDTNLGGLGGTTIQYIAISRSYEDDTVQRDILVGTAKFGDGLSNGQVLLLHLGSFVPAWRNLKIRVDPAFIGADVSAVALSPSYASDWTVVALASTGSDVAAGYQDHTYLCVGTNVDPLTGDVIWTSVAPIEIPSGSSVGDSGTVDQIIGGLSLSSNFSAVDGKGIVYAFYTINPDGVAPSPDPSNVYQIDFSMNTVIPFTGVGSRRYCSIALSGSKLLAGEITPSGITVPVRISLNASSTTPVFSQTGYPYGESKAVVAWNSNTAYCGTGGAESGFSISNDNGAHWSQVGLINTTVKLCDVAPASSPQSIFITSTSVNNIESVWRSAGEPYGASWGRILVTDALTNNLIARLSPDYRNDFTVYVSEAETDLPVIEFFNANPSSIIPGNNSTLSWNVIGATTISIDQGIGAVAASGSQVVSPAADATYTLTATNTTGTVTASVIITVIDLPEIVDFSASPTNIISGNNSTLSWNVTGATSVSINQGIGSVAAIASTPTPALTTTTTYTLTASNDSGSISTSVTVKVIDLPEIVDFSASPTNIISGSNSTLSWNVTGATSVSINQGIGAMATSDTLIVSPTSDTTYILTATNNSGSVTTSVTVKVTAAGFPVITLFSASPRNIYEGDSFTLQWDVSGAISVSIDQGIGAVADTDTLLVSPTQTTIYELTATNGVDVVTSAVTVIVIPTINKFEASSRNIIYGDSSTLDWDIIEATGASIDQEISDIFLTLPISSQVVSPDATTTYTLSAVSGLPIITKFTASPVNIISGNSSTLQWNIIGATAVSIDQGIGAVSADDEQVVSPLVDTLYTLTATNNYGSITASVEVKVTASGLPVINSFYASPTNIIFGKTATLQWNVTGATSVSIDQGIGSVSASGGLGISPDFDTTYTLTATNTNGSVTAAVTIKVITDGIDPITASVTVIVIPVIVDFYADPAVINIGEASTLYWDVDGATSVSIDQDIGNVTPSGSRLVYPTMTTTYTLIANFGFGSITAFTTVSITPQFWVSHDRGNAWKQQFAPAGIIDLAVADKLTCFIALPEGKVAKSTTAGQFWKNALSTGLPEINMLSLYDSDTLFVGGNNGDVAYSSDGGSSYNQIPEIIQGSAPVPGPVQVVVDTNYSQNHMLYAGSTSILYRWVIGESREWDIMRTTSDNNEVSGMVTVEGILYGLWYGTPPPGSGAERSLEPAKPIFLMEWDTIRAGAEAARFNAIPTSLRYTTTDTSVLLWAIDMTGDTQLMIYDDCLAWQNPQLTLNDGSIIGCDPASGRNQEVNFTWDAICADDRYQLQVAKDAAFTTMVFDSGDDLPFLLPADTLSPAMVYFQGGSSTAPIIYDVLVPALECGHTYYWRVRARAAVTGDIIRSPWSEVRPFTIKAGFMVTTPYYGPQLLAPDNGCGCDCNAPSCFSWTPFKETTLYQFELSDTADMSSLLASAVTNNTAFQYTGQLKCNTNYFWRVMALQPAPSEWSATFSFQTRPELQPTPQPETPEVSIPFWVWVTVVIVSILIIVIIILLLKVTLTERNR